MVKINMMCGKRNFGEDWVHVDAQDLPHVGSKDIYLSGYPDECADLIYCSHGIAYFDREEIKELLKEWKRVLKKGGILRLATPDWGVLRLMDTPLLGPLYGKMGSHAIYHKTIYNYDMLWSMLGKNGLISIERYDHRLTEHPNTGNREDKYDDHSAAYYHGKLISLNVQCIKP